MEQKVKGRGKKGIYKEMESETRKEGKNWEKNGEMKRKKESNKERKGKERKVERSQE